MKLSIKSISIMLVLAVIALIALSWYQDNLNDQYIKSKQAQNKANKEKAFDSSDLDNNFTTILEKVTEPCQSTDKESQTQETPGNNGILKDIDVLQTSNKDFNIPSLSLKDYAPKVYYKESIVYNNKTILYIGAEHKLEAVKRVIDIIANIDHAINKEMRSKKRKDKINATIKKNDENYIIRVNGIKILEVKDIDAKINKEPAEKLARIWKNNIQDVIIDYVEYKRPQDIVDNIIYILINLIILLIIAGVLELARLISDKYMNKVVTKVVKSCNKMVKRFKTRETAQEKAAFAEETKEKIELISNQVCHVLTIICRIIQLFLVFIFAVAFLYNIPETYIYIKEVAHYIISALLLYTNEYLFWIFSDSTWKYVFDITLIVISAIVIIYIVQILESIIINLIQVVMSDIKSKGKRFQTITKIIGTTLKILIILLAGYAMIYSLNIDMAPILAGAGIASIALSFAGQNLLKDVINGVFILIEDQFGIGDIIKINDKSGTVEDMTLRITVMRDLSGVVHIIPNSQINYVSVYTKDWSRANLDISISYNDDIDKAIEVINHTASQLKHDFPRIITGDTRVLGVNNLNNSSVDIKIIIETTPGDQWFAEREFRKRIKYAFDENNIVIPYPHMTIYEGAKANSEASSVDADSTRN